MKRPGLEISFFASSLVSAYWNGAATYYRGIVRALAGRGHRVTFYEPDIFDRQAHRDIDDPEWARVVVYPGTAEGAQRAIDRARGADLVAVASGIGAFDELLERAALDLKSEATRVVFWDVDAPATLDRMAAHSDDPLRQLLPDYDLVFTYGGGPPVVEAYQAMGARRCVPIYNALDPDVHHPVAPDPRFAADVSFLGNRLPDREARVEEFLFNAARAAPDLTFLLGGSGWHDRVLPDNVRAIGHVYTADHNRLNASALAVLNINRESMARYGFSPATRVFEAAGAGACIITDDWPGIDLFLDPGAEALVARSGAEVAELARRLDPRAAAVMGRRARHRILADHTYAHRALEIEAALGEARPVRPAGTTAGATPTLQPRRPTPARNRGPHLGPQNIVILGLSITSSWGNGHATTFRGLVRELSRRGHEVLFLERDVPWYAGARDHAAAPPARIALYGSLDELRDRFSDQVAGADLVILGSFVPEGAEVGRWLVEIAGGVTAFYDLDTPETLAHMARGDIDYLAPDLVPRFDLYLSFTGGPILERLERDHGSPCARALYCSADPETYRPLGAPPTTDLGYMGTHSADRQPALERLLIQPARACPGRRFRVAGPLYPEGLVWPDNVERVSHVAPGDHAAFYGDLCFTLNLTRRAMAAAGYAPSVRLFEAAACAAPILSDSWPGLDTLFAPGREIVIVRSTADVLDALHRLGPEERELLGRRAREVVLARHTAAHRAAELEDYLAECLEVRAARTGPPAASAADLAIGERP